MTEIVIRPATADRFDDAQHALTGGGDGAGCQCAWWTLTNAQFQSTTKEERRDLLRDETRREVPPALIAYVDGEAAGWVRVGPRVAQPRLARTRAIASGMQGPLDDEEIWAISCFVVRREFRSQGLNTQLLDAAVDFARDRGARVVEGYPIDTSAKKHSSNELFHGTLSVFERQGFTEIARPKPDRVVVSLALTE
ncbi:GNAT family N-acetyltransferase [Microbacterium lacus]|uniref:GNAT family N-acetyltransferase n=1 Tax=Microbacterium lacus TaxID=415217 RepID=UPI0038509224